MDKGIKLYLTPFLISPQRRRGRRGWGEEEDIEWIRV